MTDLQQILEPGQRPRPTRTREPGPRPPWLKVRYDRGDTFDDVQRLKDGLNLHTVCEEARCPNIDECWSSGTATFMLMGDTCTRRCGFCAVNKGTPMALDPNEPAHTAEAVRRLKVRHAVLTSVNRDDLPDGGAAHFVATVNAIRATSPQTTIELLIPDFDGNFDALDHVLTVRPEIVGFNLETVPRLYRRTQPQSDYPRGLKIIERIAKTEGVLAKTALMMGLGEDDDEVEDVMCDLRDVGCHLLSVGQFLSPTVKHLGVDRWVTPDTFARLKEVGLALGFQHVEAGPMVRSSYMAHRALEG